MILNKKTDFRNIPSFYSTKPLEQEQVGSLKMYGNLYYYRKREYFINNTCGFYIINDYDKRVANIARLIMRENICYKAAGYTRRNYVTADSIADVVRTLLYYANIRPILKRHISLLPSPVVTYKYKYEHLRYERHY